MGPHEERQAMVRTQLVGRGIDDERVLAAMACVPRHLFVPEELGAQAYEDRALPIEEGQTISQPFIVALMAQALALAATAERRLHDLGYRNVHVFVGDGTAGLPEYAPFNAIVVAAASPWAPRPLREQLADGGRLIIPVGGRDEQLLLRLTRHGSEVRTERLSGVRFVPLIGAHAWEPRDEE